MEIQIPPTRSFVRCLSFEHVTELVTSAAASVGLGVNWQSWHDPKVTPWLRLARLQVPGPAAPVSQLGSVAAEL